MRKLYLLTAFCSILTINSCTTDAELMEELPVAEDLISLRFGPVLNDVVFLNSGQQSQQSENTEANNNIKEQDEFMQNCESAIPAFLDIVLSRDGNIMLGEMDAPVRIPIHQIPFNDPNGGNSQPVYFTQESPALQLPPGSYQLEYATVLDSNENMIWLAPRMGDTPGNLANLVDNPLPLSIDLGSGGKPYVPLDVICFDDRIVNRYGYIFFDIQGLEIIEFCIFGNYCDENGRHYSAHFSVDIWKYSGDPENPKGENLYSGLENAIWVEDDFENGMSTEGATTLCVQLPDAAGLDEYYMEINLLPGFANSEEELIRAGVITDEDVRALFDGPGAMDPFHFREGCTKSDSPDLFGLGQG
ncbi:hypothetical protein [Salegentibacter sediminis]|uniref:hypothetical protein n=1 Tax=Salegentibacter sediminis TaxID=1930251 RepID=UPI0009BDCE42|nr:hypothetical protein [Salegentibacter sediminis]